MGVGQSHSITEPTSRVDFTHWEMEDLHNTRILRGGKKRIYLCQIYRSMNKHIGNVSHSTFYFSVLVVVLSCTLFPVFVNGEQGAVG